ncbi:MAG: hypothetical protein CM15mV42_0860 [uncultured marine virus]|nr:MAG: hypothetical protein CM15mV42_0860 [uncultured marine virus]
MNLSKLAYGQELSKDFKAVFLWRSSLLDVYWSRSMLLHTSRKYITKKAIKS